MIVHLRKGPYVIVRSSRSLIVFYNFSLNELIRFALTVLRVSTGEENRDIARRTGLCSTPSEEGTESVASPRMPDPLEEADVISTC